jgi:hypothetical protein
MFGFVKMVEIWTKRNKKFEEKKLLLTKSLDTDLH